MKQKILNFVLFFYIVGGALFLFIASLSGQKAREQVVEAWEATMVAHRTGGNVVAAEMLCKMNSNR